MVDFFPTAIELVGLPPIPKCTGIDQPPTVLCLQGCVPVHWEMHPPPYLVQTLTSSPARGVCSESYADEFVPALSKDAPSKPKQHAFSQWPYKPKKGSDKEYRMGYTVRSGDGYRLTQYVPYTGE